MWNDPVELVLFVEVLAVEFSLTKAIFICRSPTETREDSFDAGFAYNGHRGTAHVFTWNALESFLSRNKLSFVVRAHTVQVVGFKVKKM